MTESTESAFLKPINNVFVSNQQTPEPIQNIFMNHPFFNQHNQQYQQGLNIYIQQRKQLLPSWLQCLTTGQNTTFKIPTKMVNVPIITPEKIIITAAADTGSDIEAIGMTPYLYYKDKGLIEHDPVSTTITTGNGPIRCHNY